MGIGTAQSHVLVAQSPLTGSSHRSVVRVTAHWLESPLTGSIHFPNGNPISPLVMARCPSVVHYAPRPSSRGYVIRNVFWNVTSARGTHKPNQQAQTEWTSKKASPYHQTLKIVSARWFEHQFQSLGVNVTTMFFLRNALGFEMDPGI